MDRTERSEQWKTEQLGKVIAGLMGLMSIGEQRRVYRFAYSVIEVPEHKDDPYFEREPLPPMEYTIKRTEKLLARATYQQAVKIAAWQRAIFNARKKGGEG